MHRWCSARRRRDYGALNGAFAALIIASGCAQIVGIEDTVARHDGSVGQGPGGSVGTGGVTATGGDVSTGGADIDATVTGGAGGTVGSGGALATGGSGGGVSADGSSGSIDGGAGCGTTYFSEQFADNAAGWTLDTEWQIGSATASNPPVRGYPDPAQDHSPTADNGVAGVVIGGNASTMSHPPRYLTSPPIDLSGATTAKLSFWRWLNSDSGAWAADTIDISYGAGWVNLYSNPVGNGLLVTDSAWTWFEYDVTAYKSATFRIRFGLAILQAGSYSMSSWNIDDIVVSSNTCF